MESVKQLLPQIIDRTQDAGKKIIPYAETVTLIGNTGVGKTTLLCGLTDEILIAMKQGGPKIKIGCKQNSKFQDLIGHTQKSATKYINCQQMNLAGIPYKVIDSAGFGDTGTDSKDSTCYDRDAGVENLKNIVLLKYVLDNCKKNRLLIVLDYQQITSDRQYEVNPISILMKMIPNLLQYVQSIGIIVTKCDSDDYQEILESLYQAFDQHKHFIEVITKAGNIVSLPRPHKENIGKDLPGDYFKPVKQMIQKLQSTEFTQIQSIFENNARQYIDSQVNQIINNLQNQFNETYKQLENYINSFKEANHTMTQYEKNLNQLKNIKNNLPANNNLGNIQNILDSINSVIQSFQKLINQSQNIEQVNKSIITLKNFCLLCPLNDSNSQPILQFKKNISYKIDDGINLLKLNIEAQQQKENAQWQKEIAQQAYSEISELKNEMIELKKQQQKNDLKSKVTEEIAQLNNLYKEKKYDSLIKRVNDFEKEQNKLNEINQSKEYQSFYFLASKAYFRQNNKLDEYHIKAQKDAYLRKAQKDESELNSQIKQEDEQSDLEKQQQKDLEDLVKRESKWQFLNKEKTNGILKTPQFTYEGGCYQGYRHGQGKLFNKQGELEYDGNWSNDLKEGKGRQIYSSGEYNGYFVEGKENGEGKFTYKNGCTFEGYYQNGLNNAWGTYNWENGNKYIGTLINNQKQGYGRYYYKCTSQVEKYIPDYSYLGEYSNDKRQGQGTLQIGGAKYEGKFTDNNTFDGELTILKDKISYQGQYRGTINGKGKFTCKEFTIEGNFNYNKPSGQCKVTEDKVEKNIYFDENGLEQQGWCSIF